MSEINKLSDIFRYRLVIESKRIISYHFTFNILIIMDNKVHTFTINIDWKLISMISQIDRFDASWSSIERKEGQSLKQLKSMATVKSVGASTRIEGSIFSNSLNYGSGRSLHNS